MATFVRSLWYIHNEFLWGDMTNGSSRGFCANVLDVKYLTELRCWRRWTATGLGDSPAGQLRRGHWDLKWAQIILYLWGLCRGACNDVLQPSDVEYFKQLLFALIIIRHQIKTSAHFSAVRLLLITFSSVVSSSGEAYWPTSNLVPCQILMDFMINGLETKALYSLVLFVFCLVLFFFVNKDKLLRNASASFSSIASEVISLSKKKSKTISWSNAWAFRHRTVLCLKC